MSELRDKLIEEFQDPEYRHIYYNSFLDTSIATQIRVLRQQHRWKQKKLGSKIGTTQSGVSRLEDPEKPTWTIATLRRIAEAFDLALVVRFVSFGEALDDIENFGRQTLERPSFRDDPVFQSPSAGVLGGAATPMRRTPIAAPVHLAPGLSYVEAEVKPGASPLVT